ncbi:hypothetical protein OK016_28895 [Vibrio chagasii]|nr:hypothetical protein [Vibrio chagasii]
MLGDRNNSSCESTLTLVTEAVSSSSDGQKTMDKSVELDGSLERKLKNL